MVANLRTLQIMIPICFSIVGSGRRETLSISYVGCKTLGVSIFRGRQIQLILGHFVHVSGLRKQLTIYHSYFAGVSLVHERSRTDKFEVRKKTAGLVELALPPQICYSQSNIFGDTAKTRTDTNISTFPMPAGASLAVYFDFLGRSSS